MTIKAREVLGDCESLLADLAREPPDALWRPKWAGLVALLRAVGHVLDKIDGAGSPEARQVIDGGTSRLQVRTEDLLGVHRGRAQQRTEGVCVRLEDEHHRPTWCRVVELGDWRERWFTKRSNDVRLLHAIGRIRRPRPTAALPRSVCILD